MRQTLEKHVVYCSLYVSVIQSPRPTPSLPIVSDPQRPFGFYLDVIIDRRQNGIGCKSIDMTVITKTAIHNTITYKNIIKP